MSALAAGRNYKNHGHVTTDNSKKKIWRMETGTDTHCLNDRFSEVLGELLKEVKEL